MKVALVQFSPWDKIYYFDPSGLSVEKGYYVIVQTELGQELGEVIEVKELTEDELSGREAVPDDMKQIVRLATKEDFRRVNKPKDEALKYCKEIIDKHDLPMKLVDVRFSFEGSRITFAFIADGRVDFRELVKELTKKFNSVIRLQQIGIRDEAKMRGDVGHCGMQLCCCRFLNDLASITSEMADIQQCSHRGSDRISGVCGRLMCCLAYESQGYKELFSKLPPIGAKVNVDGKRGVVVGHHALKQSVDVEFSDESGEGKTIVEVDLDRHKKK